MTIPKVGITLSAFCAEVIIICICYVVQCDRVAGVNGSEIFMLNGTSVHPIIRGTNLVTGYQFTEGSCVIPNKAEYMNE